MEILTIKCHNSNKESLCRVAAIQLFNALAEDNTGHKHHHLDNGGVDYFVNVADRSLA